MDDKPRVHNKRIGTAVPADAVYIGRGSPWGNPYTHIPNGTKAMWIVRTREEAIRCFETNVLPGMDLRPLRGKHLVCFCKPKACHGDLLLKAANGNLCGLCGAMEGEHLTMACTWVPEHG